MKKYNPDIHHRRSIRLREYDYSQPGAYFITICTQNRTCLFGNVVDGKMVLNDAGEFARKCWMEIPNHFPRVTLDEFVIMPNHIHGIIIINVGAINVRAINVGAKDFSPQQIPINNNQSPQQIPNNVRAINVGAKDFSPQQIPINKYHSPQQIPINKYHSPQQIPINKYHSPQQIPESFQSPSRSIGSIVRGFKIGITKWFRQNTDIYNIWQRNYYEHIIQDEQALNVIREYIINNPLKWELDKNYMK